MPTLPGGPVVVRYPARMPATLEERFVAGDERALAEAFAAHSGVVLGLARKSVGSDADDVAQQVFVSAWQSRHRFDAERGSLRSWLIGITRFKIIDHLRAAGRRAVPTVDDGPEVADPVSHAEQLADRLVLTDALDTLPAERRMVVELAFYNDLSHPEIAERTGLPLGTVKSHARRGLATLRAELEVSRDGLR